MNLSKLKEPFSSKDIEWRLAQCGKGSGGKIWGMCLAYITARAIMDRLDDVCGPENWKVSYEMHGNGIVCLLSVKCGDEWVTKQDGAEQTEIESFKGGISSALKRAGSAWGIGRYLYGLESGFVQIVEKGTTGALYGQTKEREQFYWLPPTLPLWALPKDEHPPDGTPPKGHAPKQVDKPNLVITPKAEPKKSRAELISSVMTEARRINCSDKELGEWAQDVFKKPTKEMTDQELERFHEILAQEQNAQERMF